MINNPYTKNPLSVTLHQLKRVRARFYKQQIDTSCSHRIRPNHLFLTEITLTSLKLLTGFRHEGLTYKLQLLRPVYY